MQVKAVLLYLFGVSVQIIKETSFGGPWESTQPSIKFPIEMKESWWLLLLTRQWFLPHPIIISNSWELIHTKSCALQEHNLIPTQTGSSWSHLHGSSHLQSSCRMRIVSNRGKLESLLCERQVSRNLYPTFNFPVLSTVVSKLPTNLKVRR